MSSAYDARMNEPTKSLTIRMPATLYDRLQASASEESRTLNAETVLSLTRGVETAGRPDHRVKSKQVELVPPPGIYRSDVRGRALRPVHVEEEMVPLALALWGAGIPFWMSQYTYGDRLHSAAYGPRRDSWLAFEDTDSLMMFLSAVLPAPTGEETTTRPDSMTARVRHWEVATSAASDSSRAWLFSVTPDYDTENERWYLTATVTFPQADLADIIDRLNHGFPENE